MLSARKYTGRYLKTGSKLDQTHTAGIRYNLLYTCTKKYQTSSNQF